MKQFYLDQNIVYPAVKDNKIFEKIKDIIRPTENEKLIVTPFSLLEFSGIKKSNLFQNKFSLPKNPNYETLIGEAEKFYRKNIRKDLKVFLLNRLKEMKEREEYKSSLGQRLIDEYENYINKENFENEMIQTITIDQVSSLNYPELRDKDIHLKLTASAVKVLKGYPHINMVRLEYKSAQCCFEKDRKENKNDRKSVYEREEFEKILKEAKYDNKQDTVDTEIIHLACFGWDNKPVQIVTTDSKLKIEARIFLYRRGLKYSSEPYGIDLNFCKSFEIVCLDGNTYKVIDKINLKDIENLSKN